jgi:hypothetical protein
MRHMPAISDHNVAGAHRLLSQLQPCCQGNGLLCIASRSTRRSSRTTLCWIEWLALRLVAVTDSIHEWIELYSSTMATAFPVSVTRSLTNRTSWPVRNTTVPECRFSDLMRLLGRIMGLTVDVDIEMYTDLM